MTYPYPPSKYIYLVHGSDIEDAREIFRLYDSQYVAEHKEIADKLRLFHEELYLRLVLQRLLKVFNETFDYLRDLENQIELAEQKYGIKIIHFVGEEEGEK